MVFLQPPQGALSENVRKSYGLPTAPPEGPQRKREEILRCSCISAHERGSTKTEGLPASPAAGIYFIRPESETTLAWPGPIRPEIDTKLAAPSVPK
jgi:hypothetical protein